MTSAFIYSCSEMKRGSEGSDVRGKERQGLSNGEDTSNTSKKERGRGGGVEKEAVHVLLSMCLVDLSRNA